MSLPHWNLSNVFPGLESPEFKRAAVNLAGLIDETDRFLDGSGIAPGAARADGAGGIVNGFIERANAAEESYWTLRNYTHSFVTTDSYNTTARRVYSELDALYARMTQHRVRFKGWLGGLALLDPPVWEYPGAAREHAFYLRDAMEQSRHLMSQSEEAIASELGLSGIVAWHKLQGTVTSQLTVKFARGGKDERLPIAALQNLSRDPDPDVRRRAYEAELGAWASVREPLAACMNGVKGAMTTLNRRRGWEDSLAQSLHQARIDRATLDAMMGAMQDSFPAFRKYLRAKARRLGGDALPWWNLFAPVGGEAGRAFTGPQTREFVVGQFGAFSVHMAQLAERAFASDWIDAEPREGKRGGAFCMGLPAVHEPRVLCNFDGSLDQVFTVAHELGHAFHYDCQKGRTELQRDTPMTLSETASIFCETLITEAALARTSGPDEELTILETFLQGATQVIVDIASRLMFECEVFGRRAEAELSADDFCEIMLRCQKATYGDGLDERHLHSYMWAWKPHYYRDDIQFYNYPYAFGLLFGLGLFAIYKQRGSSFAADYETLLASTGEDTPANLAARFGFDIRRRDFWANSLKVIESRVERYCAL